jgi:UDP-N-acetylmuramate: L-alanyl-gamma-D-glutamyl-meso-diaminopimelate ligase
VFDLKSVHRIYFLAVCGTAMASLAAMLKSKGYDVYGSDEGIYPPMSTFLEEHGIPVSVGFSPDHLTPEPDLVVVGNVISRGNVEIEQILASHIPYMSLPEAIREFFIREHRSIVVTGTHGKTTTTSLLAWLFNYTGRDPSFLIGGIPNNFGRGFQVGAGRDFIIEGDEYDSAFFDKAAKFLRYMPDIGIINIIEYDHADIYASLDEIKIAFERFVRLIPGNGLLVVGYDSQLARDMRVKAFCPVQTFGIEAGSDWTGTNIQIGRDGTRFDVQHQGASLGRFFLPLHGEHNVRNALAAIIVALHDEIPIILLKEALAEFKGVRRRLELVGTAQEIQVYDDFGHHPTAIRETLSAFRAGNQNSRIWALFEPRTATTRRNVFQNQFAATFDGADFILIAPVDRPDKVPAGQLFSADQLATDLNQRKKSAWAFQSIDNMADHLIKHLQKGDIVITFSNGPFGNIHQKILMALKNMQ